MPKDKNKPKGPTSAYACFIQVIREEHRRKHPNEQINFTEFSKKCGEKWKSMGAKEKKRFEDMASNDKKRYEKEMQRYVPEPGTAKKGTKRKAKDPNMPKRGWSAFFFFCDEFRPAIRKQHPDWKVGDVAKELGRRWEHCTDKTKYEAKAEADKQRYERDMKAYKSGTFAKKAKGDVAGTSNDAEDDDDEEDDEEDDE